MKGLETLLPSSSVSTLMTNMFYRIAITSGLVVWMATLLTANESTTVYGLDFSKTYIDPNDRTAIMEDVMSGLKQAEEVTYRTTDEEDLKPRTPSPTAHYSTTRSFSKGVALATFM